MQQKSRLCREHARSSYGCAACAKYGATNICYSMQLSREMSCSGATRLAL